MAKKRQNYLLDGDLIKKAKSKCILMDTNLTAVITELLTNWVK